LLRQHGQKISIAENFSILLPDDAKILLHKNFKLTPTNCHKFVSEIHTAKDLGITSEKLEKYMEKKFPSTTIELLEKSHQNLQFQLQTLYTSDGINKSHKLELENKIIQLEQTIKTKKLLQCWKSYEKLKTLKNLLDYSDLNQNALALLIKHPEISEKYDYLIVDEFQDTNKLQCDLLEKLSPRKNITVVGDSNQSIYRFRGAYKDNLSNFKKAFDVTRKEIYTLDKSYRSTNKILRVAHKLIQNNYDDKKECFPVYSAFNKEGEPVHVYQLENSKEEIRKIIEIIKQQNSTGIPLEEICVLFRTHQQSRLLKNQLEYEKIPYTSATKKSLLKLTPIKLTINYLTILNKRKNKSKGGEQAWWDLIYNSDFSKEDIIMLTRFIKENRSSDCLSFKILNTSKELPLSNDGKSRLHIILSKIKSLFPELQKPIPELILKIYETAGLNSHDAKTSTDKEKILILQKFHEISQEYTNIDTPTLSDFIHHLDIINSLGIEINSPSLNNSGIRIMTQHATKGLEYNTVIISNFSQKRFPMEKIKRTIIPPELSPELSEFINEHSNEDIQQTIRKYEQENQLLEERRLCYVAFTRAKNNLFITNAKKYGASKFLPSQFLNEIDYKQNKEICFQEDTQLRYKEPSKELKFTPNINTLISSNKPEEILNQFPDNSKSTKITFSPSSLQTFNECQKKYEYKYVYNMPDPPTTSWEALKLGSFAHEVFDKGVKANYKTEKEFIDLAKSMHMDDKWSFIEINNAFPLIKTFFYRHKNKYSEKSLTEHKLSANLENIYFHGVADRIDFHNNNELEIIDYKTGDASIQPKYRNRQLGFYALAAISLGKPKRLTLDTLKKENPIIFELDDNGDAKEIHSTRTVFNLNDIKHDLIETAKQIILAYSKGFKPCPIEKSCPFCEEYIRSF
jgi:DNA helicase II / ATP-dependent DNA helicase PcrA